MRGAIPPLLQHFFMAWCLVKHRDNFKINFESSRILFYNHLHGSPKRQPISLNYKLRLPRCNIDKICRNLSLRSRIVSFMNSAMNSFSCLCETNGTDYNFVCIQKEPNIQCASQMSR
jgi:hypothetical protein